MTEKQAMKLNLFAADVTALTVALVVGRAAKGRVHEEGKRVGLSAPLETITDVESDGQWKAYLAGHLEQAAKLLRQ